jgi:membrane protease YdiL (CAAX protease family)
MGGMAGFAWYGARQDRERGQRISERLRLVPPRGRNVIAGVLLGMFMLATFNALRFIRPWLTDIMPWGPPAWFADLMTGTHFQGMPLKAIGGRSWSTFVQYVFNIFGEELLWRGYILPRQELSLGTHAWLANGILWNLFHWFFYWNLIPLLPSCLALAWLTQRSKNTWTGILGHGILNGTDFATVIMIAARS